MKLQRLLLSVSCALLLAGCGQSAPALSGFDAAAWQQDARGCKGQRRALFKTLYEQRDALYGKHIGAVSELLGRPDEEELQEQVQRVYYYYLEPGGQCAPGSTAPKSRRLVVRFGSLGTVIEVLPSAPAPMVP
ncbi:hypothetical protein [Hymenobacter latericus]|uniref:hypothetical protein n=1 Tax=Hymenobacter sp. YIM 151858-1 TaxID=2987688 RepID=UPI002227B4BE|nr:hypothetical protein [Hymenobacter sp. YIM 151858-1]UYZ60300.1 hypothetical protein OIS50_05750 [Hymenobacter sp. YIM 151858-1]